MTENTIYTEISNHVSEDFIKADEIKTAPVPPGVIEPIKKRWSVRAFSPELIQQDELETLFEAASWAPSAMNEQPWRYIAAIKGTPGFDRLASALTPSNKIWAEQAAVLVLSIAQTRFHSNGKPNHYAMYDTGAANYGLLLQAQSMNIYGHIMGGFDHESAARLFALTENQSPVAVIALGYPGSPDELPDALRMRELSPRNRKPISDFVTITD